MRSFARLIRQRSAGVSLVKENTDWLHLQTELLYPHTSTLSLNRPLHVIMTFAIGEPVKVVVAHAYLECVALASLQVVVPNIIPSLSPQQNVNNGEEEEEEEGEWPRA